MRRVSLCIVTIAIAAAAHAGPLAIGDAMPVVETTRAGALGDAGALVVFHSPACEASRAWEPALTEIGNAATRRLVHTTIVEPSDRDQVPVARAAADRGMRFTYVADASGAVVRAFGAAETPEAFLFDAHGRLVYHGALGAVGGESADYLAAALDAMLAGRPVPIGETATAGCSIGAE
jgi:hypothetical protein